MFCNLERRGGNRVRRPTLLGILADQRVAGKREFRRIIAGFRLYRSIPYWALWYFHDCAHCFLSWDIGYN